VSTDFTVLYEDNHLLAINKPAGLPTIGVQPGRTSAVSLAKLYLKHKYRKPGNVYLGVMSRLDAVVTGVLLLARTSKAAARLTEQFKRGMVEKVYWALVEDGPGLSSGEWTDHIIKDESQQRMRVVGADHRGAQIAALRYRRLAQAATGAALVEVHLLTGRKHQIRVQLASRGRPILGDAKYESSLRFPRGIALHARRLVVEHPVRNERIALEAPLPGYWRRWVKEETIVS
jgi:23S rRNA pseudouridine1911/1915/1917 synthase